LLSAVVNTNANADADADADALVPLQKLVIVCFPLIFFPSCVLYSFERLV